VSGTTRPRLKSAVVVKSAGVLKSAVVVVLTVLAVLTGSLVHGLDRPAGAAPPTPTFGAAIDAYSAYQPETACDETVKPGVAAFRQLIMASYPRVPDLGTLRACGADTSEHYDGRAWDWGADTTAHPAEAHDVLNWLLATDAYGNRNAVLRRLGIMYLIYDRQIWGAWDPSGGWKPYIGSDPHTSHIHFSFGWGGALQHTSWWAAADGITTSAITARYQAVGGASRLGALVGPEQAVPGGRVQHYVGGNIYWSVATGAQLVYGAILARYLAAGGPGSFLGLPVTDEIDVPGGRASYFQSARVYWSGPTGAQEVHGDILRHYLAAGGPASFLGLPVTDEIDVPGGRASYFQGARMYWSAATGAQEVHGAILGHYLAGGGPDSRLGLPVTDEIDVTGGRASYFQGARVYWSGATGAHRVYGGILADYLVLGGPDSAWRLPTTDEFDIPGGRRSTFSGGRIDWSWATSTATPYLG